MKKIILTLISMLLIGVNTSQADDGTGNTGWRNFALTSLDGNIPGGDDEPTSNPQVYIGADGAISNASFTEALFSVKLWGNFIYKSATNPYIGFKEDNSNDYNYIKVTSLKSGYYIKKIVLYDSNMSEDKEDDNNPVITASNGTWSIGYYSGGQSTSPSSTTTAGSSTGATHIVATCSSATNGNSVTIKADDHTRFSYIYIEYNTKELNSIDSSTPFQYTCAFSTTAHQVTYNGTTITPVSNVKSISSYLDRNLTNGTHYTVTGTTSATAPGKYTTNINAVTTNPGALANGSVSFDWWITKSITHSDITVEVDPVVFNGTEYDLAAVKSKVKVYDMIGSTKTLLTEGTHYTLGVISGHSQFLNAKTYVDALVITGVTNNGYTGERKTSFTISPKPISECSISATAAYTGSAITTYTVVVTDGSTTLTEGTDKDYTYTVTGSYTDVGVYPGVVTVTGHNNYTGVATADLTVGSGTSIAGAMVTSSAIYTGANLPPAKENITVKIGSATLTANDYDLTYAGVDADYKDAKTYSNAITITGKGATYYGTITADYVIEQRDLADAAVQATQENKMTWTGSAITPVINGTDPNISLVLRSGVAPNVNTYDLVATTDYTYTSDPTPIKEPGIYTITFEGRGNFKGTKQLTVNVLKSITAGTVHMWTKGMILPYQGTITAADLVVKDGDKTLVQGTDYTATIYESFTDPTYYYEVDDIEEANDAHKGGHVYIVKLEGLGNSYGNNDNTDIRKEDLYVFNEYNDNVVGDMDVHITDIENFLNTSNTPNIIEFTIKGKFGNQAQNSVIPTNTTDPFKPLNNPDISITTLGSNPSVAAFPITIVGIEKGAFKDCAVLQGIDLSNISTITDIEAGAFEGCKALRYVNLINSTAFTPNSLDRTVSGATFYGVPKQALIYLHGNTITGENYVYLKNGTEYVCDVFKIYDDVNGNQQGFTGTDYQWAYENKYDFTANTIENTRQLKAGQHYTVCLPYELAIPSTLKAYTLDASSSTLVGFKEVTGTLAAFTPYVVIASGTGNLLSISTGGQIPATTYTDANANALNAVTTSKYDLVGTMRYMDGDAATGKYIMQADKTWKQIPASTSYSGPSILPMRAYINATASPARLSATFTNADGSTTAINDLQLDNEDSNDIYDLQGRKVNGQSAAKGVYIKNGKKLYK